MHIAKKSGVGVALVVILALAMYFNKENIKVLFRKMVVQEVY